ncbi:MAG: DUF1109 domain-containing protein [Hydrogenophilales bacterium]|nr:DUF1109 domain-containing protein [Hydrogenophilales bacterium]
MKTDDLVRLLATGEGSVQRHAAARRYAIAIAVGVVAAGVLMLGVLGVRHDLAEAVRLPMFWAKIGYVASLGVASLLAVLRLSRPGARLDRVLPALAVPVVAMWTLAAFVLAGAEPGQRMGLLLGATWTECPFLIAMLSAPMFAATLWAMRGLAPTRLPLAGTAAGLLSGTVGGLVYCLHCPEMEAPFIGIWYLLGMLIPAATGALLGRRVLRW